MTQLPRIEDRRLVLRMELAGNQILWLASAKGQLLFRTDWPCDVAELHRHGADVLGVMNRPWQRSAGVQPVDLEDFEAVTTALAELALPPELLLLLREWSGSYLTLEVPAICLGIPWETMRLGDRTLSMDFAVGRVLAGRADEVTGSGRVRGDSCPDTLMVWANPGFDLLAAENEANVVERVAAAIERTGQSAPRIVRNRSPFTRRQLLDALASVEFFHYAGHAHRSASSGLGRAWPMLDGDLTAADVLSDQRRLARVVFAHACGSAECRSAVMSGMEMGLIEALLSRGVQHFVGTWTPMLDAGLQPFVARFYHELFGGTPMGEALRRARGEWPRGEHGSLILRENYVLYGNPGESLVAQVTPPPPLAPDMIRASATTVAASVQNSHSRPARLDPGELSYPVTCRTCGRVLRGRFLIAHSHRQGDEVVIVCRHCEVSNSGDGPPETEGAPQRLPSIEPHQGRANSRAEAFCGRVIRPEIELAWQRIIRSLGKPRRLVDTDSGREIRAYWRALDETDPRAEAASRQVADRVTSQTFRCEASTDGDAPAWELHVFLADPGDDQPLDFTLVEQVLSSRGLKGPTTMRPAVLGRARPRWRHTLVRRDSKWIRTFAAFASATGWSPGAIARVCTDVVNGGLNVHDWVVLLDLKARTVHHSPASPRLHWCRDFFAWEEEYEQVDRVMNYVQGLRPLAASLSATAIIRATDAESECVLLALRNLASLHRLRLDHLPPFGWVLSEEDGR